MLGADRVCVLITRWQDRSVARLLFLFPLNRARWLRSDVINHAVDSLDLVDDPRRDPFDDFPRKLDYVSSHSVFGINRSYRACVSVRSIVAHHANGLDRKQYGERLPDVLVEASLLDLGHDDRI